MLRTGTTVCLDRQPDDLHVRKTALAALVTAVVLHRPLSTGLVVVSVNYLVSITLLTTTTSSTTIVGTRQLTAMKTCHSLKTAGNLMTADGPNTLGLFHLILFLAI